MRFAKTIHLIFFLVILGISVNISTFTINRCQNDTLSPSTILKQDTTTHTFSKSEQKKIDRLAKNLEKQKDDYTLFLNILKKNNPKLIQAAIKQYLENDKSEYPYLLPHLRRFINSDSLNKKTYKKILKPLLTNYYLLAGNKEALPVLAEITEKAIINKDLDEETKKAIVTDAINVTSKNKVYFHEDAVITTIYAPIFDYTRYAKILVDMLFPKAYHTEHIHLSLHMLSITIRKDLLPEILKPNQNNSFKKNIIHILAENNSTEKEEQITKFLNANYNKIKQMHLLCKTHKLPLSDTFADFIIRRRQVSLLEAMQPYAENQAYIELLKELLKTEKLKHKKHNVIKESILSIHTIFTFAGKWTQVPKRIVEQLKNAIADFNQGKTGNKKFNERIKSIKKEALSIPLIQTIENMTQKENEEIKRIVHAMLDKDLAAYNYLFNLCDIYNRTKTRFHKTSQHLRETMSYLVDNNGDLEKLNQWLYKEAPWNKALYNNLINQGYLPDFWNRSIKQTYLADPEATKKARKLTAQIKKLKVVKNKSDKKNNQLEFLTEELNRLLKKEPKIIVELEFDFLKDSHSGAVLHDSISPHKAFEVVPPALALDTSAVFMHIYNADTKKPISSILFVLTPQGLVDMGFPTDSPNFEEPVFNTIATLVDNKIIPQVNLNSKKTSYVDSATYNYAAKHRLLAASKTESVKKEPWNMNISTDPKNPRHYATGGNQDINGRQHGIFNTSFTINQRTIKKYRFFSLDLVSTELNLDADRHLYSNFLDRIRQKIIEKSKTLKTKTEEKQYIKEMLPHLTTLKKYMQQHNILPEKLRKHKYALSSIIPTPLLNFIDEEMEIKPTPLNSFFARMRGTKNAKFITPQSA